MQDAIIPADKKGAALDAHHPPAVHVFLLDDAIQVADGLVAVREQVEREPVFRPEILMGPYAVAGDAENDGAQLLEFRMMIAESLALPGAARSVVTRVEMEHHMVSSQRRKG